MVQRGSVGSTEGVVTTVKSGFTSSRGFVWSTVGEKSFVILNSFFNCQYLMIMTQIVTSERGLHPSQ